MYRNNQNVYDRTWKKQGYGESRLDVQKQFWDDNGYFPTEDIQVNAVAAPGTDLTVDVEVVDEGDDFQMQPPRRKKRNRKCKTMREWGALHAPVPDDCMPLPYTCHKKCFKPCRGTKPCQRPIFIEPPPMHQKPGMKARCPPCTPPQKNCVRTVLIPVKCQPDPKPKIDCCGNVQTKGCCRRNCYLPIHIEPAEPCPKPKPCPERQPCPEKNCPTVFNVVNNPMKYVPLKECDKADYDSCTCVWGHDESIFPRFRQPKWYDFDWYRPPRVPMPISYHYKSHIKNIMR